MTRCAQCDAVIPPPGVKPLFAPCCSLECAQTWDARSCEDRGCSGCPDCQGLSGGQLDDLVEALDDDGEMLKQARQVLQGAILFRLTQAVVQRIALRVIGNVGQKRLEATGDPRAATWRAELEKAARKRMVLVR